MLYLNFIFIHARGREGRKERREREKERDNFHPFYSPPPMPTTLGLCQADARSLGFFLCIPHGVQRPEYLDSICCPSGCTLAGSWGLKLSQDLNKALQDRLQVSSSLHPGRCFLNSSQ